MSEDNPFDRLGLDPRLTARALTERLRERAERALPEERAQLQGLWRKLTLKETERIRWALTAHPRSAASSAEIEKLREATPPHLSRREPPALDPSARDALIVPRLRGAQRPPTDPPDLLAALAAETDGPADG